LYSDSIEHRMCECTFSWLQNNSTINFSLLQCAACINAARTLLYAYNSGVGQATLNTAVITYIGLVTSAITDSLHPQNR